MYASWRSISTMCHGKTTSSPNRWTSKTATCGFPHAQGGGQTSTNAKSPSAPGRNSRRRYAGDMEEVMEKRTLLVSPPAHTAPRVFRKPPLAELQRIAQTYGFDLTPDEAASFRDL